MDYTYTDFLPTYDDTSEYSRPYWIPNNLTRKQKIWMKLSIFLYASIAIFSVIGFMYKEDDFKWVNFQQRGLNTTCHTNCNAQYKWYYIIEAISFTMSIFGICFCCVFIGRYKFPYFIFADSYNKFLGYTGNIIFIYLTLISICSHSLANIFILINYGIYSVNLLSFIFGIGIITSVICMIFILGIYTWIIINIFNMCYSYIFARNS